MAQAERLIAGTLALSDFETVLRQQEQVLGPLIALAISGTDNLATFERLDPVADDRLVVLETYDTTPPQKTGHALVCAGVSLVGGLRRQVAAYRPS